VALWVRWSWRDLRSRWLLVVSIALIIGLGTGLFAGLGSTATWRKLSNDASYSRLGLHDVEVRLATGVTADEGTLRALVDDLPDPSVVAGAEERLIVDTQIDASKGERVVLVSGQITGAGTAARPARIDRTQVVEGTGLGEAGGSTPAVLVDNTLARRYHLPSSGTLTLAGGTRVRWVGHALQPEWFWVVDPTSGTAAGSDYGVLFATLADAQSLNGTPGKVNSLVLRRAPGVSRTALADGVRAVLAERSKRGTPLAATVTRGDELASYKVLYKDAEGDQEVWNAVSLIVLAGAAFASANLVNRIIESQRRELGVGMALGARPGRLAIRPLLVGLQVGLCGVVLGVLVGLVINRAFRSVLDDVLPLPVWLTPFQFGRFARAAALGLVLPLLATVVPVIRAVRVQPVDALQTTKPASGRSPFARLSRAVRFKGQSVRLLPVRDLVRAPRRTIFTAVGVAAAISVLVGVLGMVDSYLALVDRSGRELTGGLEQVNVDLDGFPATDAKVVRDLTALPSVGQVDASLLLPAQVTARGREPIDTLLEVLPLDGLGGRVGRMVGTGGDPVWRPSLASGRAPGDGEILLSRKAAEDLGVGAGDTVTLTHLALGPTGVPRMEQSRLRVSGLHGNPLRAFAYLDDVEADRFGLAGTTNELRLTPAPGHTVGEVQRAVFSRPGVRSARSVGSTADLVREMINQYLGIFRVIEAIPIGLALLVAFNSSTIGADERRRDHATMFAFGLSPRRVLGLLAVESLVTGILGTAMGLGAGWMLTRWVMGSIVPRTMPELAIDVVLSPGTVVAAGLGGVVAVTLAPLFVYRRLSRLDVPASLRVVE
jgi:putative ABC transport system permease protein